MALETIKAAIRPFYTSKVFVRNFFAMLIIATVASLSLLSIAVYQYEREGTMQAARTHDLVSQRMAREMGLFFEQAHIQLKITAAYIKVTKPNHGQLTAALNSFAIQARHFIDITLYDERHRPLNSSSVEPTAMTSLREEAISAAVDRGQAWVSPVTLDEGLVPVLYMSVPLERLSTPFAGLTASLSLRQLWWWLDQINAASDTLLSVVRDRDGIVIADLRRHLIGKEHPEWKYRVVGKTILSPDESSYLSYHAVPQIGVVLVTTSPRGSVTSKLYEIRYQLFLAGMALLATAGGIAFFFAWSNFRPVQALITTMESYAKGDSTVRAPALRGEYGRLGDAFNTMADEINQHKETLVRQESLVFVGKLASSLAHDMRHGLHVIQNIVYLITDVDPEYRQMLKDAVADLTRKIEDLLEFARSGTMFMDDAYVELIVEETLDSIRYAEIAKKVDLKVENRIAREMIRLDRVKIVSSLGNIMRNAVEAGAKQVVMTMEEVGNRVHFTIRDDGPGVPADILDQIFVPFFSSKKKGFGVGLSIARLIARNHGGDVELLRTGATGTQFLLWLPLVAAQGEERRAIPAPPTPESETIGKAKD
ncbi:MAG: sensor histidine kinase [Nitrospinae bacterium]|nr:sensor histidine kinase [Nitrospinota bacterium]